jgi:hypothetical protein
MHGSTECFILAEGMDRKKPTIEDETTFVRVLTIVFYSNEV